VERATAGLPLELQKVGRRFIAAITGIPEALLQPDAPLEPVSDSALLRMLPQHESFAEPPEACNHARPIGGPCYGCAYELPEKAEETLKAIQKEANKLQQAIQRLPEPPEEAQEQCGDCGALGLHHCQGVPGWEEPPEEDAG